MQPLIVASLFLLVALVCLLFVSVCCCLLLDTSGYPLPLSDASKTLLRLSVFNDTLFLSSLEIVDYSIIVGLDDKAHKLVVGIIGTNEHAHTHAHAREASTNNKQRCTEEGAGGRMQRENADETEVSPLCVRVRVVDVVLDFIRTFTWDKRLEMGVKSVGIIAGQNIPTIISPQNYKIRSHSKGQTVKWSG